MDFLKSVANSASEEMAKAADAISTAAGEKELEAHIWNDKRQIKGLKTEWGAAAYDAHMNSSGNLNAITQAYTVKIEALCTIVAANTQKLRDEFGHAPPPSAPPLSASDPVSFPPSEPGVFEVVHEGGIRYRNEPVFHTISDCKQLALPQTQYEIRELVTGDDGLEYAYISWLRYFLPTRLHNGDPMLKRIGEPGTCEQLKSIACEIFNEMDTNRDDLVEWEEMLSFMDGAEIAYDVVLLRRQFDNSSSNIDGKVPIDGFIELYMKCTAISDIVSMPTWDRQKVHHHPSVNGN